MTPEQEAVVFELVAEPGRPPISHAEFLARYGADDGVRLGVDLLRDALVRKDADQVDPALIVCFTFGVTIDHLQDLLDLGRADWHESHEDVVEALRDLRSESSIAVLRHLAEWRPAYTAWDDAHALAVKAVWALGDLQMNPEAAAALRSLEASVVREVADAARRQWSRSPR